jgi:Family of unknown function (DUF6186)
MSSGDVTAWGFTVIGVAVLAVEVAARRPGSRIPTLGDLAGFIMRERWGRLGMLFVWWWIGWHFLSRS